jgi:hypothetical protein
MQSRRRKITACGGSDLWCYELWGNAGTISASMSALAITHSSTNPSNSFRSCEKPALNLRAGSRKASNFDRQLGLFAETSQPPDTGVVEPPINEELQGMNLVGVNDAFCHLSSGPKYSPRAGVVLPVSAGG